MKIKTVKWYVCEKCETEYVFKESAMRCESEDYEEPLLQVGDKIFFKDCEETPVALEALKGRMALSDSAYNGYSHGLLMVGDGMWLEVLEIYRIGHKICYMLGKNGVSLTSWNNWGFNQIGRNYPTIGGNELLKKILEYQPKDREYD